MTYTLNENSLKLQDLLRELMQRPKKQQRHQPCLFNFILYTKKEHINNYLTSVIKRLAEDYPCRIIIIQEELDLGDLVAVADSVDFTSLSCDLYTLHINASQKEDLPLLLFPLLKSDLPTFLLWAEDMLKIPFSLVGIENYLTKVIFDSNACHDLIAFAAKTIEYIEKSPYSFSDLNWNRIEQWQQLFAEQFNRQDKLSLIEEAQTISISYNASNDDPSHVIQALYLQAWISLKLNWKLTLFERDENSIHIEYFHDGKTTSFFLYPDQIATLSEGRVISVQINSGNHSQMKFTRDAKKPHIITIEQVFPSHCEMPITYFFDEERFGRSLSLEIYKRSTHKSLYRVLCEIANYPERILCH